MKQLFLTILTAFALIGCNGSDGDSGDSEGDKTLSLVGKTYEYTPAGGSDSDVYTLIFLTGSKAIFNSNGEIVLHSYTYKDDTTIAVTIDEVTITMTSTTATSGTFSFTNSDKPGDNHSGTFSVQEGSDAPGSLAGKTYTYTPNEGSEADSDPYTLAFTDDEVTYTKGDDTQTIPYTYNASGSIGTLAVTAGNDSNTWIMWFKDSTSGSHIATYNNDDPDKDSEYGTFEEGQ